MILSRKNTLDLFSEFDALNLGTGDTFPSTAVSLNDASGTFRNYILLTKYDKTEKETGQVTLNVSAFDFTGGTVFTCSATYWIGSTRDWSDTPITTDATWDSFNNSGTLSGFHDYLSGTITNTSAFNFAKLTFAENEGYLNASGTTIDFDLILTNGVVDNVNANDRSFCDFDYVQEWLNFPHSIAKLQDDVYIMGGYGSEQAYQGDFSFIFLSDDRGWTDRKTFEQYDTVAFSSGGLATQNGGKAKIDIRTDNPSASNTEIYLSMNRNIYRFELTGFDGDGKPIIANFVPMDIGALTAGVSLKWAVYPFLYTNGVPLIFTQNLNTIRYISILQNNNGTYATPDCDLIVWGANTLATTGDWANKGLIGNILVDSSGSVYVCFSGRLALDGSTTDGNGVGFRRFTLNSGGTITNPLDWTQESIIKGINDGGVDTGVFTGTGDIVNCRAFEYWAIDESDIVNGEPTFYISDSGRSIILRMRHNGGVSGTAADWTVEHIIGTAGVAGDVNGSGTTTQITTPRIPYIEGDYVYIPCRSIHKVKRFHKTTLVLEDWRGGGTYGSLTLQTEGKKY